MNDGAIKKKNVRPNLGDIVYDGKFIRFVVSEHKEKTEVYDIILKEDAFPDVKLGVIKWYSPWRKYSMYPIGRTVWEETCLGDVIGFLNKLATERRLM